jgi:hypothetical protein
VSKPISIRFDDSLLARLRRRAVMTSSSTSALAQRLIDEGLRMADHPGVIFKDGPTGRRAALPSGPDVWEVTKFLREIDERGPAALDAAADGLGLDHGQVSAALSYYADFPDEIEWEIKEAEETSERAERAWRLQRRLIS